MTRTPLVCSLVAGSLLFSASLARAADAAPLYKSKCANCHGANGEGKPAMKSPAFKGTALSADQIQNLLTQGAPGRKAPHAKAISGVNAEQAKALGEYITTTLK